MFKLFRSAKDNSNKYGLNKAALGGELVLILTLITFGAIFVGVIHILDKPRVEKYKREEANHVSSMKKIKEANFDISKKFDDARRKDKFIAIDEKERKVALVQDGDCQIFNYRDVLESKIVEDGQEITTTSRSSQIGGALVGSILAGGRGDYWWVRS